MDFTRTGWSTVQPAGPADDAWSRGQLWVDNQRLDDFLAELNRYRPGWLHADPAVAGLRFSGVFPLDEGDRKSTRLNSSHSQISYAVFCLKKKKTNERQSCGRVR